MPSQMQNLTVWDQLVRPVHQALIKFPERLPEVASESRSGDELIESIQCELAELDDIAKPVLKKG